MTREKASEIDHLLLKIEMYEGLVDELMSLRTTEEIKQCYGEDIESELVAIVKPKIDALLKDLEENY